MGDAEWRRFADLYRIQTGEQAPIRGEHKWAIGDAIQQTGADLPNAVRSYIPPLRSLDSPSSSTIVNDWEIQILSGYEPKPSNLRHLSFRWQINLFHCYFLIGRRIFWSPERLQISYISSIRYVLESLQGLNIEEPSTPTLSTADLLSSPHSFFIRDNSFYLPIEIDEVPIMPPDNIKILERLTRTMMLWGYIAENTKGEGLMARPVRELYEAAGPSQAILFSKENSAWLKGDWATSAFLKASVDDALKEVIKAKELEWSDEENTAHMIWKLLQSKCRLKVPFKLKQHEIERYAGKIMGPDKIISLHLLLMIPKSLSMKWETSFKVLQERHGHLHPRTPFKIEHISPDTIVEEISGIVGRESLAQDGDRAFLMQRSDGTGGSINNVHPSHCGFVEASSRFSGT
ncbi:hypothetical protein BT69DRAFT_1373624 [Atractiella rhizophila]|nr:hypothetical protein BT69DRAFT_1373624 [Atractiella rhizophila]